MIKYLTVHVCVFARVYYRPVVLAAFSTDTIPNQ